MGQEIERKFLVTSDQYKKEAYNKTKIKQGYLSSVPERAVRIRVEGNNGFITIKGIGNSSGAARFEWEQEISLHDAEQLLKICEPGVINKIRFEIKAGKDRKFEVDEFHGENDGLVVAEIELKNEDEIFDKPDWLGKEITGDIKYYNAMLMKTPFKIW